MTCTVRLPETRSPNNKANQTREKILTTSARIFRSRGYKATTMRIIATEAQMQAGSVYYHFKSKDEILDVVLERGLRDIYEGVKAVIEDVGGHADYRFRIYSAIKEHLKWLLEDSEFTSANIRIYGQLPKDVRKKHQPLRNEYAKLWDDLLSEAQKAGLVRQNIKIIPLRQFILGALNWTVEWFVTDKYSVEAFSDRAANLILDGMYCGDVNCIDDTFVIARTDEVDVQKAVVKQNLSKFERTGEGILVAAAKLFQEEGYEASTMRKIAIAANLKAGSFYYHYKSKRDILDEILDRGVRDVYTGVRAVIDENKDSKNYRHIITEALSLHLNRLLASNEFTSVNIRTYSMLPLEVKVKHRTLRNKYAELWEKLLADAQDAGQLRSDVNVAPLQQFILGALNWTVEWYDTEKYSVDILAERCALLMLDGICEKPK